MKICKKCNKEFPCWTKIDGINKNLNNRKFCLDCSPWGKHNTVDITVYKGNDTSTTQICLYCKVEKPKSMFYTRSGRKVHSTQSVCRECSSKYTLERQHKQKQQCIDYKGGKCQICGYRTTNQALQFHHLEPNEKEFAIGNHHLKLFENVKNELDKCILLCANCHIETHAGLHKDVILEYIKNMEHCVGVEPTYPAWKAGTSAALSTTQKEI